MNKYKMRVFVFLFAFSILITTIVNGQYSSGGQISVNSSSYGILSMDNSSAWNKIFITDRPTNTNFLTGSPFINPEWQLADIVVVENKGEIRGVLVRVDAKFNLIEIKDQDDRVKVLHASNTYSLAFKTSDEVFVSNKTLRISEPEGFFKIIHNKKSSLLCHYSTKLIEETYNAILDAGIKEDKMVIDQTYYIFKDGKLTKLEKNRKKLIRQFDDQPQVVQYIKDQHIMPKEEYDLLKLIGFIDSLT
jgi:hypothetical protein